MRENGPVRDNGFWMGKTPCWVTRGCIPEARQLCRSYQDQSRPCWEENTLCKELFDMDTCSTCEVFKLYGGKQELADNNAGDSLV